MDRFLLATFVETVGSFGRTPSSHERDPSQGRSFYVFVLRAREI